MSNQTHLIIDICLALIGSLICFYLDSRVELSKVEASVLPTFIFSLVLYLITPILKLDESLVAHWATVFFGATFIGMTSSKLADFKVIAWASIIYVLIYNVTLTSFVGFGGKLGFVACVAVIISLGVKYLFAQLIIFFKRKK